MASHKALQARFAILMVQEMCGHDALDKLIGAVAEGREADITAILDNATHKTVKERE
jgi:hypothetical protein